MIKVEHTKIHLIFAMGLNPEKQVLVAPAKLVLVECKSEEALLFRYRSTETIHILPKKGMLVKGLVDYLKPIFISESEKILDGDWILLNGQIQKAGRDGVRNWEEATKFHNWSCYKILALPEHFSPQILSKIVSGELKDGDKILLEVEEI